MKKWLLVSMTAVLLAGYGCASSPSAKEDESGNIRKNADQSFQDLRQEEDNRTDDGSGSGY
jgi:uncharacterized protein YcfL